MVYMFLQTGQELTVALQISEIIAPLKHMQLIVIKSLFLREHDFIM